MGDTTWFATNGYGVHSPGGYSLIACLIAAYTVIDKHGVVHASPVAYLELTREVIKHE